MKFFGWTLRIRRLADLTSDFGVNNGWHLATLLLTSHSYNKSETVVEM